MANGTPEETSPAQPPQKRATVALNAAGIASLADRFTNFENRFEKLEETLGSIAARQVATVTTQQPQQPLPADHVGVAGEQSTKAQTPAPSTSRGQRFHPYARESTTKSPPAQTSVLTAFNAFTAAAPKPTHAMTSAEADPDIDDQVRTILESTVGHLAVKGKKKGFPHTYVYRGDKKERTNLGELNISEYCWGLMRVIEDQSLPAEDKPFLVAHLDAILEDSREFPWKNVRRWSEEIFSLVSEKRIKGGWSNENRIEMLRMSISRRYGQGPSNSQASLDETKKGSQTAKTSGQPQEHLRGGPPCKDFNNTSCSLQSCHMVDSVRRPHICNYCLINLSSIHTHAEKECRIKQKKTSALGIRQSQGFRE